MSFTLILPENFAAWIEKQPVRRKIQSVQHHHTWTPNYTHFNGGNHLALQKGMQQFHKNANGWSDIGQHFTIFPDGVILTGRSLESSPACIYGQNKNAICIENLGNFDAGGDEMTDRQRRAIIVVTAALCKHFGIPVDTEHIVYHHWYDLNTGKRTGGSGVTKTCPGTNFFGGNSVDAANKNLIPAVLTLLNDKAETVVQPAPTEPEPPADAPVKPAPEVEPEREVVEEPKAEPGEDKKPGGCLPVIFPGMFK